MRQWWMDTSWSHTAPDEWDLQKGKSEEKQIVVLKWNMHLFKRTAQENGDWILAWIVSIIKLRKKKVLKKWTS